MPCRLWPPSRQKPGKFWENTALARGEGRCRDATIILLLGKSIDAIFNDVQVCVVLSGRSGESSGVITPRNDVPPSEAPRLFQQC